MIVKLVLKNLQQERARFITAVLGVGAATGLVVWSLGLSVTSAAQGRQKAIQMTAPFSCWVSTTRVGMPMDRAAMGARMRPGRAQLCIPSNVVVAVASLPEVERATACRTVRAVLDFRPGGHVMQGPPLMATLVQADASGCPYTQGKVTGTWPDPASEEPQAAVCSAVFTPRRLSPPPVGSPLVLITRAGTVTVKITAIVEMPQTVNGFPTLFASAGAMKEALSDGPVADGPNLLLCAMRGNAGSAAVRDVVARLAPPPPPKAAATTAPPSPFAAPQSDPEPSCSVADRGDVASQFSNDKLANFKRQAPLLLMLSVLTALCMLVNALTVGIEQKLRILALLRAAGMTARQVAQVVAFEGALITVSGWCVGMLGGWGILECFVRQTPDAFPEGVSLGWITPAATAAGILLVGALSLFWPCRRALRIRPLDAWAEERSTETRPARVRTAVGVALLFPMLILAFPFPLTPMLRSVMLLAVGIPLHVAGLILCLPAFIRGVEGLAGPAVSALLRLDRRLLHRRISRYPARTAGMVLTLAVGLGSYSAIHIWGASMMDPFIPSHSFPDAIVSILPNGVPRESVKALDGLEGLAGGRCLPIEAAQFFITEDLTARTVRVSGKAPMSPNVLLFGADPRVAFGGDHPMAPFKFVAGSRQQAADALEQGGACVVTRMFNRETGLGVGDTLTIQKRFPRRGGFGGGRSPGAGPFGGMPPGAMEAAPPGATPGAPPPGENAGLADANAGTRMGPPRPQIESLRIVGVVDLNWHMVTSRAQLRGRDNMPGGTMGPVFVSETDARRLSGNTNTTSFLWANLDEVYRSKGALQGSQLLEAGIRKKLQINEANTVRVHHRDEIEDGTLSHGAQLIGDMARAPFWSLIVLSTGIISLLIASFQASAKEIAVMRAIGMTRGQLGRMLLGEAVLAGLCGIALSLISGFCIGWTFTGWTRAWMAFGGLPVSISIPWVIILRGVGFAFVLCVAMAVLPIVWLVRKQDESGGLTVL